MKLSPDGAGFLRGKCDDCRCVLSIWARSGHDIECPCGALYNGFGQRLVTAWSRYEEALGLDN